MIKNELIIIINTINEEIKKICFLYLIFIPYEFASLKINFKGYLLAFNLPLKFPRSTPDSSY